MLDTRQALGESIKTQFLSVAEYCTRNGIDPALEPIPVAAAAHYHMGGIATDKDGRASLGNLWVCGEASSTGLHGANRLASNGLLEALVYARICADGISDMNNATEAPEIKLNFTGRGTPPNQETVAQLRKNMTDNVGVVRNAAGLTTALRIIADLEKRDPSPSFLNMCATATLITLCALNRKESRGAHARSDFPDSFPGDGERSTMTYAQALTLRDAFLKETI